MAEVLIMEFADATADHYFAVNKILGIDPETGEGDWPPPVDPETGEGDWPPPLLSHIAGFGKAGLVVVEVWESQAAQAGFMDRLGPALGEAGVPQPTRMEWRSLLGNTPADQESVHIVSTIAGSTCER